MSLRVQVLSSQVSSALRMRSLHLVERSEPISERNIAFREYLGPQGGAGQGGAGVLLGCLGRSAGQVRCQPVQRDVPKAKALPH